MSTASVTVSALFYYLVKSCRGSFTPSLQIGDRGPINDRLFMVTDRNYRFRTQRREQGGFTKLAFIKPYLSGAMLSLRALGMPALDDLPITTVSDLRVKATVHGDSCDAIDQGDRVGSWLSTYLGVPSRLVAMAHDHVRQVDPVFSPEPSQTGFADAYPVLLISDGSLNDLNRRLWAQAKLPVKDENFRSNIWVKGCDPYEEDRWKRIRIGDVVFDVVKPCQRCSITQVDLEMNTYRPDHEPLLTLGRYRHQTIPQTGKQGVMFGQNLVHRNHGTIQVGDVVEVLEYK